MTSAQLYLAGGEPVGAREGLRWFFKAALARERIQEEGAARPFGQHGRAAPQALQLPRALKLKAKSYPITPTDGGFQATIEARAYARYAGELAAHEEKLAVRLAREEAGEKPRGKGPTAPSPDPRPKDQYTFTDPESRIMKTGGGFEQSYNAQAVVEVDSRLIVGERASQAPNDKQELGPTLAAVAPAAGPVGNVLADNGFYSAAVVRQVEQTDTVAPTGTTVFAPLDKTSHNRSVADLEKSDEPAEPVAPATGASGAEVMRHRLKTVAGKTLYKKRQQTVEPVFGIIKAAMGFRRFLLRGVAKVGTEWTLVCLAYNLRRLHRLSTGQKLATGA